VLALTACADPGEPAPSSSSPFDDRDPLVLEPDAPVPEDPPADDSEPPAEPAPAAEPSRPDLPSGGYLEASRFVSADLVSHSALAELWSAVDGPAEPGRLMYDVFPEDACFSIPGSATTPTFYDFVDVGDHITLRGDDNLQLAREMLFSNIFYKAYGDNLAALAAGATYDVEYAGGAWQDALRMPAVPVVNAPAELNTGLVWFPESGELEISFQPTGADRVYLILQRDYDGVVCRLADDGAFTLSSSSIAGAPEWGTMVLLAVNRTWVEHEGRAVEVIGTSGVVADFER
jgi:hypothetical protein